MEAEAPSGALERRSVRDACRSVSRRTKTLDLRARQYVSGADAAASARVSGTAGETAGFGLELRRSALGIVLACHRRIAQVQERIRCVAAGHDGVAERLAGIAQERHR